MHSKAKSQINWLNNERNDILHKHKTDVKGVEALRAFRIVCLIFLSGEGYKRLQWKSSLWQSDPELQEFPRSSKGRAIFAGINPYTDAQEKLLRVKEELQKKGGNKGSA